MPLFMQKLEDGRNLHLMLTGTGTHDKRILIPWMEPELFDVELRTSSISLSPTTNLAEKTMMITDLVGRDARYSSIDVSS